MNKNLIIILLLLCFSSLFAQLDWPEAKIVKQDSPLRVIGMYPIQDTCLFFYQDNINVVYINYYNLNGQCRYQYPRQFFYPGHQIDRIDYIKTNDNQTVFFWRESNTLFCRKFTNQLVPVWINKIQISLEDNCLEQPKITVDQNGGIFFGYKDASNTLTANYLDPSEQNLWGLNGRPLTLLSSTRLNALFCDLENNLISIFLKQNNPSDYHILISKLNESQILYQDVIIDSVLYNYQENYHDLYCNKLENETIILTFKKTLNTNRMISINSLGQIVWANSYESTDKICNSISLPGNEFLVFYPSPKKFDSSGALIGEISIIPGYSPNRRDYTPRVFVQLDDNMVLFMMSYLQEDTTPETFDISFIHAANKINYSQMIFLYQTPHVVTHSYNYSDDIYTLFVKAFSDKIWCFNDYKIDETLTHNYFFCINFNTTNHPNFEIEIIMGYNHQNYFAFPVNNEALFRFPLDPALRTIDQNGNISLITNDFYYNQPNLYQIKSYSNDLQNLRLIGSGLNGNQPFSFITIYNQINNNLPPVSNLTFTGSSQIFSSLFNNEIWVFSQGLRPDSTGTSQSVSLIRIDNENNFAIQDTICSGELLYAWQNYFVFIQNQQLKIKKVNPDGSLFDGFNTDQSLISCNPDINYEILNITDYNNSLFLTWSEKANGITGFYTLRINPVTGEPLWTNPVVLRDPDPMIYRSKIQTNNSHLYLTFNNFQNGSLKTYAYTLSDDNIMPYWSKTVSPNCYSEFCMEFLNERIIYAYISSSDNLYFKTFSWEGYEDQYHGAILISNSFAYKQKPILSCTENNHAYLSWMEGTKLFCQLIDVSNFVYNNHSELIMSELFTASCYPNPFNPDTAIHLNLSEKQNMAIDIYNIKGQKVKALHQGILEKGTHKFLFKGQNDMGLPLSSGIYFCRVKGAKSTSVMKITLMK